MKNDFFTQKQEYKKIYTLQPLALKHDHPTCRYITPQMFIKFKHSFGNHKNTRTYQILTTYQQLILKY